MLANQLASLAAKLIADYLLLLEARVAANGLRLKEVQ